jgi:DNA-binding response OmpR family regulator
MMNSPWTTCASCPPSCAPTAAARTSQLSPRDVKVLRLLYQRTGKVVDRNTLADEVWGVDYFPESRALDQHISQLRKRIEKDPSKPRIIRTVHGAGYRYE